MKPINSIIIKKLACLIIVCFISVNLNAQTLIATSQHPEATANHNQRKIVRDFNENIYVVFMDEVENENIIMGISYDFPTGEWGIPIEICPGTNPSLSISVYNDFYLVYETNGPISQIMVKQSVDFTNWTSGIMISDSTSHNYLPVADVDAASFLNVFWVRQNEDYTESVIHSAISGDSLRERQVIATKDQINDIAIAGHLQYLTNDIYFAIQYNQDSLQFFHSSDYLENIDTVYEATGSQPCITYNEAGLYSGDYYFVRLLYLDTDSHLIEIENDFGNGSWNSTEMPWGSVDFICIDDLVPPLGYSFIFMQNGNLYHGFSYGVLWDLKTILDTISGATILHPALAYKQFNFENVDFIWMEENGESSYDIYYKRDAKYIYPVGKKDYENGKGFSVVISPNPFSSEIFIEIQVEEENQAPVLEIFNTQSQLVATPNVQENPGQYFYANWDGSNKVGEQLNQGTYILLVTIGDKRTARKIVLVR